MISETKRGQGTPKRPAVCPMNAKSKNNISHSALTTFSSSTQNLVLGLLEKSGLSKRRQKDLLTCLEKSPECSLPMELPLSFKTPTREKCTPCSNVLCPGDMSRSGRRSRDQILRQCDSYKVDAFRPKATSNREKEIERLQSLMSGSETERESRSQNSFSKHRSPSPCIDPIEELSREIKEREEWYQEMKNLGQGKQHQARIQSEIQIRKKELENLQRVT